LSGIKSRNDPDNMIRINPNIVPTPVAAI
jgi:hypothetical protein